MTKKRQDKITVRGRKKLAVNIKTQLDLCNLTQKELGEMCNLSKATVSHIVNGRISPTLGNLMVIRDALDKHCAYELTIDKLLKGVKYKK